MIQTGQVVSPTVPGNPHINGIQMLLEAMNRGVSVAKELIAHVCSDLQVDVAPLIYEDMSSEGALMRVASPFVLMDLNMHGIHHRMGYVFVPSALVRKLLQRPGTAVVWTTHDGSERYYPVSAAEEAELLQRCGVGCRTMYTSLSTRT